MKKYNYFIAILIISIVIFSVFSAMLYHNVYSDLIKGNIINDNLTLASLGPATEGSINGFLSSLKPCQMSNVSAVFDYTDSATINEFYESKCLFLDLDSLKIFRTGNDSVYIMDKDVGSRVMPSAKAYTYTIFVTSFNKNFFGNNGSYKSYNDFDISRKYGYFHTSENLINFRNYNYEDLHFSIFLVRSKSSITKELNDFAVLIAVIIIIAGLISITFIILFVKSNEKAIKIEERTKRQIEFIRLNKLLGIEQLSESIIHNINTPLTSIKGFLQVMENREPDIAETYKIPLLLTKLDAIIEQINTILQKTRQDMSDKIIELDIESIIDYTITLKSTHIQSNNIMYYVNTEDNLPIVRGIHGDITMILENFIDNAVDSMFESEKRELHIVTCTKNGAIIIAVKDTGMGIKNSVKDRIFDLYFTTKHKTSDPMTPIGTGIGLYSVNVAAERNNWEIQFDSEYGKGSTFYIQMPFKSEEE